MVSVFVYTGKCVGGWSCVHARVCMCEPGACVRLISELGSGQFSVLVQLNIWCQQGGGEGGTWGSLLSRREN